MKEIKFRAWNKNIQIMAPILSINFSLNTITAKNLSELDVYYWRISNCEIMQYTGLKDINGKEIYEGDIIKIGVFYSKVFYDTDRFVIKELPDSAINFALSNALLYGKVVGNIYENPEFLENKQ